MVLTVEEIMSRKMPRIKASANAFQAAKKMKAGKLGYLMVVEGGRPVGIVTEADLVGKVLARGINPEKVAVSRFMSKPLITVPPHHDIAAASMLMAKHNIRHLPVVDGDRLVGVVTAKDIIKHVRSYIEVLVRSVLYEE
ncbi:MAG: signal transduction protein [Candidatus Hecatellales archaeon B24]|nr:MAG: signal transduction protein [Candidatus Hecatellales archaeon B24]